MSNFVDAYSHFLQYTVLPEELCILAAEYFLPTSECLVPDASEDLRGLTFVMVDSYVEDVTVTRERVLIADAHYSPGIILLDNPKHSRLYVNLAPSVNEDFVSEMPAHVLIERGILWFSTFSTTSNTLTLMLTPIQRSLDFLDAVTYSTQDYRIAQRLNISLPGFNFSTMADLYRGFRAFSNVNTIYLQWW